MENQFPKCKNYFVKKYWDEEDVLFYLHFHDGEAVRQIEISPNGRVLLTLENPQQGESMLYDQSIDELSLQESDFISKEEFDEAWDTE